MRRTISVVDLASGEVIDRTSNTATLDVPADLDRTSTTVAQLDAGSHLHYLTAPGRQAVRAAFSRPLSWRVRGEECLIEELRTGKAAREPRFHLSAVENQPQEIAVRGLR